MYETGLDAKCAQCIACVAEPPWSVYLHTLLDLAAAAAPAALAIRDERGSWSYAELAKHSTRFAGWLAARGVRHGDRVLLRLSNRRELAAAVYGTSRVGAVAVPVSREMKPFLLVDVIRDADPAVVVLETGDRDGWISVGTRPVFGIDELWAELGSTDGDLVDRTAPSRGVTISDPCLMIYTSGSTSRPKAVVSSHNQVRYAAHAIAHRLNYQPHDIIFVRLPLSFDYGLYQIFLSTLRTATVLFSHSGPEITLYRQVCESRATIVPLVPAIAATLVALAGRASPEQRTSHPVRLFTNTGATLSPQATARLRQAFPGAAVSLMFGITECKRVSIMEPDGDLIRPHSVGRPLPGTEVQILTEEARPAPMGVTGEIVVRGPHVMSGYWRSPELTAARFRSDPVTGERRLHTGDYGHLDADGYLYFSGRRDDIVKHRGVRVSLVEIESAVSRVPGVIQCAVQHSADDDQLVAFVTGAVAAGEVLRQLAEWLEPARRPDSCYVVESLPTTPNGKVDQAALRQEVRAATRG